jgi:hypothetical protein
VQNVYESHEGMWYSKVMNEGGEQHGHQNSSSGAGEPLRKVLLKAFRAAGSLWGRAVRRRSERPIDLVAPSRDDSSESTIDIFSGVDYARMSELFTLFLKINESLKTFEEIDGGIPATVKEVPSEPDAMASLMSRETSY